MENTPFYKPSHTKHFVLVRAVACLRLRRHKLVVEAYQLWKESSLSSTKDNKHTVQRSISSAPQ